MKIKNYLSTELPSISLKLEMNGTTYRFNGIYDGKKSLPSKLLQLMEKENTKGADNQSEA